LRGIVSAKCQVFKEGIHRLDSLALFLNPSRMKLEDHCEITAKLFGDE
jgi:hypothetical protein